MPAFRDMPAAIPAAEQEQLRAQARKPIADKVVPAYNKLLAFFRGEDPHEDFYDPRGGGDARRKGLLPGTDRPYTTSQFTALSGFTSIGPEEVARITTDTEKTKAEAGFTVAWADFITFLGTYSAVLRVAAK